MAADRDAGARPEVDFDPSSAEHAANWPGVFADMRRDTPRAWSGNFGGYWVATRYSDVLKIAQAGELFTSAKMLDPESGRMEGGVNIPSIDAPAFIPLETDGAAWKGYRQFLNPRFSPKAADAKRRFAKDVARALVDRFIETGSCDLVEEFTSPLPAIFTMHLLGLDIGSWREFADPVHKFSYTLQTDSDVDGVAAGIAGVAERLAAALVDRRSNPRDDLLSHIANGEIDGRRMSDVEANQMALMIVLGGTDTTTGLAACVFHYLDTHPEDRRLLMEDPSRTGHALEEFVRFFSPVHAMARTAREDCEMDGWRFRKGDRIMLTFASANRDETIFERADELQIGRSPNRHIGFGAGMHRCLGSFFGRMLMRAMLEEVFERLPDYRIEAQGARPYPSVGIVNGWINLPASFTPGPRLGSEIAL